MLSALALDGDDDSGGEDGLVVEGEQGAPRYSLRRFLLAAILGDPSQSRLRRPLLNVDHKERLWQQRRTAQLQKDAVPQRAGAFFSLGARLARDVISRKGSCSFLVCQRVREKREHRAPAEHALSDPGVRAYV